MTRYLRIISILTIAAVITFNCIAQDDKVREAYRVFNENTDFHRGLYIGGDTIAVYGVTFDSLTNRKFAFYG